MSRRGIPFLIAMSIASGFGGCVAYAMDAPAVAGGLVSLVSVLSFLVVLAMVSPSKDGEP